MLAHISRPVRIAIALTLAAALLATGYAIRPGNGGDAGRKIDPGSTRLSHVPTSTKRTRSGVVVDLRATGQVMDGFGVSARTFDDPHMLGGAERKLPPAAQRSILQSLFGDLGLTRMRSVLDPGLESMNDNDDPNVLDPTKLDYAGLNSDSHVELARDAMTVGLRTYYAAPVTVEAWMAKDDVKESAESALALIERWRSRGLDLAFYSPLNEPNERGERSADWYLGMVKELGARLRSAGLPTKLIIADDVNPSKGFKTVERVLADPEARQYVGAVAYHVYGGDRKDRQRIGELGRRYGLPVWMTEYSSKDYDTWPGAIRWAVSMSNLITEDNVSAVDYLWGFTGEPGNTLIRLGFDGTDFIGPDVRPPYDIVGQFSRFVRPGAVRVGASGSGPVVASAFSGPDGNVVIVLINPTSDAIDVPVSVRGGALTPTVAGTRSSSTERMAQLPALTATAGGFHARLPSASITTFVVPLQR